MQIIEEITYSLDDIINQIKETFGFIYNSTGDSEGYILIGSGVRLSLKFFEEKRGLKSAVLKFPDISYDLVKSPATSDLYLSGVESAVQIVDLINRMLGSGESND